jgi:hypothetical protein
VRQAQGIVREWALVFSDDRFKDGSVGEIQRQGVTGQGHSPKDARPDRIGSSLAEHVAAVNYVRRARIESAGWRRSVGRWRGGRAGAFASRVRSAMLRPFFSLHGWSDCCS